MFELIHFDTNCERINFVFSVFTSRTFNNIMKSIKIGSHSLLWYPGKNSAILYSTSSFLSWMS
jgi:hypothetical protein